MDGMFVKQPTAVPGALQHPKHKIAQILDAEDPSRYDFNIVQANVQGTRVPLTTEHGGVMKSDNPFGKVVQGEEIVYLPGGRSKSTEYAPEWLQMKAQMLSPEETETVPLAPAPDQDREASKILAMAATVSEGEADAQVEQQRRQVQLDALADTKKQRLAEAELKRIMEAAGALTPEKTNTVDNVRHPDILPTSVAESLKIRQHEQLMIKMQGAFGTYKGNCAGIQVEDNLVVLIYAEGTDSFSPPPGPTPFRLSCGKESFDVYFVGIEFELPQFGCSLQVLIRSG